MPAQGPSTSNVNTIDLGNAVLSIAPAAFASFADASASTAWRRLGLMKSGSTFSVTTSLTDFFSGTPKRKVKSFYDAQEGNISGEMLEFSLENLADATGIGRNNITYTTLASAPAPTTVVTGSTTTVINFTSVTGYQVGDKILVGTGATAQVGTIKTIAALVVTLYDGLSRNLVPGAGLAIAKIATSIIVGGSIAAPLDVALRLQKTHVGTGETYDYFIPKAQADGAFSLGFIDNSGTNDGVGIPFNFSILSDNTTENGNIFQIRSTQA